MILLREVLAITSAERSYLVDYVYGLQHIFNKLKTKNGLIPWTEFKRRAESLSEQDLFQGEYKVSLPVRIKFDTKTYTKGEFHYQGKLKYSISINLVRYLTFEESPKRTWWVRNIDYAGIRATLAHELVHFRQKYTKAAKLSDPFKAKKSYMSQGYEQGAWAAGEYETILQYLEKFTINGESAAPYVLKFIRNNESLNYRLKKLKADDFTAWKQIMKRVVLIALKDMKANDTFPWQKSQYLP